MQKETEEKLAQSLTAQTTELIPFLPYLFQDFWELGINPRITLALINKHINPTSSTSILDLACGKGAASVKIAQKLHVQVKGIDLIPAFIEYAKQKAQEYRVCHLCEFAVDDINDAAQTERGYDCVIFGAIGDVLGGRTETLQKLKAMVKQGGYLLLDNYDFAPVQQWIALFEETGLELVETVLDDVADCDVDDTFQLVSNSTLGMAAITKRANELILKHPDKKAIFEEYIRKQQEEYDYIEDQSSLDNVIWMLRKK